MVPLSQGALHGSFHPHLPSLAAPLRTPLERRSKLRRMPTDQLACLLSPSPVMHREWRDRHAKRTRANVYSAPLASTLPTRMLAFLPPSRLSEKSVCPADNQWTRPPAEGLSVSEAADWAHLSGGEVAVWGSGGEMRGNLVWQRAKRGPLHALCPAGYVGGG